MKFCKFCNTKIPYHCKPGQTVCYPCLTFVRNVIFDKWQPNVTEKTKTKSTYKKMINCLLCNTNSARVKGSANVLCWACKRFSLLEIEKDLRYIPMFPSTRPKNETNAPTEYV